MGAEKGGKRTFAAINAGNMRLLTVLFSGYNGVYTSGENFRLGHCEG